MKLPHMAHVHSGEDCFSSEATIGWEETALQKNFKQLSFVAFGFSLNKHQMEKNLIFSARVVGFFAIDKTLRDMCTH